MWDGGSLFFCFFRRVVWWVRGRGLGIELGVSGGEWSFAGYCSLRGCVLLWVRLGDYLCAMVAADTWCTVGASGGVVKVIYEVGDVLV